MAEVGRIQIEVDARQVDKAVDALNKMGISAKRTGDKVEGFGRDAKKATTATNKMADSSKKLTRMFGILSAGIGGLTFAGLATSIESATTQLNNIEATMRVATGSSQAAGQQLAFIREEADRLGLFFPAVAKQMAQFSAAARGTSITSEELKTIFTGISEASRAMGLTAPETEGAMKALQQMMSKGKVSAEELRQQLGERMPGSIQIMASALGVTTQKLFEMMENGELLSDEVLPKFGREMMDVFGPEAARQAERIAASIQRLRTAFFDLMSQGDLTGTAQAIDQIAVTMSSPEFQNAFDNVVQSLSELAGTAARNIETIVALSKVFGALILINVAKWAVATVGGLTAIRTAAGFLAGPAGLLALVATGLYNMGSSARDSKEGVSELDTQAQGLISTLDDLLSKAESFILESGQSIFDFMFSGDGLSKEQRRINEINEEIAALIDRVPRGGVASRFIQHELKRLREERAALQQVIDSRQATQMEPVIVTPQVAGGAFPMSDEILKQQEQQKELLSIIKKSGNEGERLYGKWEGALRDVGAVIKDDVIEGLTDIIMQAESASDVFASLADQIARTLIQQQIADPLVSSLTDFATSAAGNIFSPAGSQSIGGGAPPTVRGIGPPAANGGNVFSNKAHLVGERGPELFVPGQDGRIIPNHQMGGSGDVTVNVINQGGEPLQAEQQQTRRGPNGEMTVDLMVKSSIERLDGQGQLDGVFRRHGARRQGQF